MTLKRKRNWSLVGIFVAAAFFIWMGLDGWTIKSLPAHYPGFILDSKPDQGTLKLKQ